MFQNDELEFLIPEHLYQFRVRNLETLLRQNTTDLNGVELSSYYTTKSECEDSIMTLGLCNFLSILDTDDESEPHFQKSGYKCIKVKWDSSEEEMLSPWEVVVPGQMNEDKNLPGLSEIEKKHYNKVISALCNDEMFNQFQEVPDCSMYVDYLDYIEVPMYLSRIKKRIQSYYTTREALYADVKLILENCRKYNKEHVSLFQAADLLQETFFQISEGIDHGIHVDDISAPPKLLSVAKNRRDSITSTESLVENITPAPSSMKVLSFQINKTESSSNDSDDSELKVARIETRNEADSLTNSSSPASAGMCTRSKKFSKQKHSRHHEKTQNIRVSDAALCALQNSFPDEHIKNSEYNVPNKKNSRAQEESDGNEAVASINTRLRSKTKEYAQNASEPKFPKSSSKIRNSSISQKMATRSSSRNKKSENTKNNIFSDYESSSCEESYESPNRDSYSSAMEFTDEGECCDESDTHLTLTKTRTPSDTSPQSYFVDEKAEPTPTRSSARIKTYKQNRINSFSEDEVSSEGYTPKPSKRKGM